MQLKPTRGLYLPGKGIDPLHIVSYKDGNTWVCRCLDYDFTVKSNRKELALLQMKKLVCELFDAEGGRLPRVPSTAGDSLDLWDRRNGGPPCGHV